MRERRAARQRQRLAARAARLGLSPLSVEHDGRERLCLFYAGNHASPAPLLIVLHGGAGNPFGMARKTRFHDIAAREGFIVVYPGGAGPSPRRAVWNAGAAHGWAESEGIDDVGFIRSLIDRLSRDLPIDRERIYAAGHSKGAMMAYRLALEASDAIAAIAAVSGPMCATAEQRPQPVAVLHIHGARDQNVPFRGGRGRFTRRGALWPSSEDALGFWRSVNEAAGQEDLPQTDGIRKRWAGRSGADVELIYLTRRGHRWPTSRIGLFRRLFGLAPKDGIEASEEISRFLRDKRRVPSA